MKNLTEKEKDYIAQQLAEFFYEYFKKRDLKVAKGKVIEKFVKK